MRPIILGALLLLTGSVFAQGQQPLQINRGVKQQSTPKIHAAGSPQLTTPVIRKRCGFSSYLERMKLRGYNEQDFEQRMQEWIRHRIATNQTAFTGTVTIPVVFHVIYRSGQSVSSTTPNLPAAKIQAQISQLNADYGNQSGSAYGVAADVRIRFCLAVVDTAGRVMSEPGIDRVNGSSRGWSNTNTMSDVNLEDYFETTIKPATIWDPFSYFNVWTAAMDNSGLLGYSTFPSLSTLPGLDDFETSSSAGCVINFKTIGSISVPGIETGYDLGRTLTHEAGHFFGLRHIWGDAACGNDFCNDTPPQDDATSGCPSPGTLNNCTPSVPKMFENYMDYTDDACVNTFTAAQALRCQAAMDNSPRRFSLMASKACQARAGNAISFSSAARYLVDETGAPGACPNSRTYTFRIYVSDKATGNATVTFNVQGGTALRDVDFVISPASVSYSTDDASVKTLTLTILDDQVPESLESITIGYSISGNGVVAGPDKQSVTMYINDDDVAGVEINQLAGTRALLNENFNAAAALPAGWTTSVYDDGTGSYVPNQWVVSPNGGTGTSGNAAHITSNTGTRVNQYSNSRVSDAYLFTPLLNATGLKDLVLSFKWRCLGEAGYDEGYIGYIPEGQAVNADNVIYFDQVFSGLAAATAAQTVNLDLPVALSGRKFYLVFNWYNDESLGSNPPFTVDDVQVTGKNYVIATTQDADTSFAQFSGQFVHYFSKTGTANRLIATISQPSADIGCLTAAVQSAGNGKTALNTSGGSYFRTDKVIRLSPASGNASTQYRATFYFTPAELSTAWTAAEIPNLKILKVREGVSLSGILGSGDAELVVPEFLDNTGEAGYYSYTGDFTGFSQFMLVSPATVVPVHFSRFEVQAARGWALLNWQTAREWNNLGFAVERSDDGIRYSEVGWVDGTGNLSAETAYQFRDLTVQPGKSYYYRLRQTDADNRYRYSPVRRVQIPAGSIALTVAPVPASGTLQLRISGSLQQSEVRLLNPGGAPVRHWTGVRGSENTTLNIAGLAPGVYFLQVQTGEELNTRKVLIK